MPHLAVRPSFRLAGLALLAAAAAPLVWPGVLARLLDDEYMPHGHCYFWEPALVGLHLTTDALIGLSYVAISLTLAYFVARVRRDLPFNWMFVAFGVFIIACGMTHFLEIVVLWKAVYWLSGYLKLATAAASVITAVALPPLVPKAMAMIRSATVSEERRTELQAAHEKLGEVYQRLAETDELKTAFFANVSHELRTPLTLVLGPAERMLASKQLTPEARRDLESIAGNARLVLEHVNDLLDVAKLDAGRMGVRYARLDLAELVRTTTAHFVAAAADRHVVLETHAPDALEADVDPDLVARIAMNLLGNAIKFTPSNGRIDVRLKAEGDRAVLEVDDTGPGVPDSVRETIFERFRQADHGATRRYGGTGLGLAIVRELVELHHGRVDVVRSELGGACFRVELPLVAPASVEPEPAGDGDRARDAASFVAAVVRNSDASTAARPSATDDAEDDRPRVLVVEDNREMATFVAECLEHDYRVTTAVDGAEGLARAIDDPPDLVITDVMMPEMSGDELVRQLHAHPGLERVPIVALTARSDDALRVRMLSEGAHDYLTKPFSAAELAARARNLVAMKRVRDVLEREMEGRTTDLAALARELGARKRELAVALEASEESNRLKDEFLATVSHELRTPLTSILGWTRMLRSGGLDEASAAKAPVTIERNVRSLARLVEDLLDVSRAHTGKLRIEFRPVDVPAVVESALDAVRPALEAKRIHVDVALEPTSGLVLGDASRLQQVAWNLLANAVKFCGRDGTVAVRLTSTPDSAVLTVRDDGRGIDPAFLPHVFERFRQADGSISRVHGGLGLGLSIVRHIVEAHGGEVRAESEGVGHGATFVVSIPFSGEAEDEASSTLDAVPRLASDALLGVRVLAIDDDPDARDLLEIVLQGHGATVLVVETGAEAVAALDAQTFDVVVSDIGLAGENGYDLIEKIRSLAKGGEIPAVALTAFARDEDRRRALAAGFDAHVAKPVEPAELVTLVSTLAGRGR